MKLLKRRFFSGLLTGAMLLCFLSGCGNGGGNGSADTADRKEPTEAESPDGGNDETYKITVAVGINEDQPGAFGLKKFKEDVESKSNGKMTVEIFFNGVMGGDTELTDAVIQGNITMGMPGVSAITSYVKELNVIDTPFLFSSVEQARKTLDSEAGQKMLKAMDTVGLKGLSLWENGGFRELTANKEVHDVSDVKGLKIRVMQSDLHIAFWSALGANPAPLSYSELYTALQQGAFDCQENPLSNIQSGKFYEVQKYVINTNHIYAAHVVFMNKGFWESLPTEYQNIIQDSLAECNDYVRGICSEQEEEIRKDLEGKGTVFIDLSDEELETFRAHLGDVYNDISETVGEEYFEEFCTTAAEMADQS